MSKRIAVLACSLLVTVVVGAQAPPVAGPRFRSGSVPELPALAVGGGEVLLDVALDAAGRVTDITPVRSAQPFTDATVAAVRGWLFVPPKDEERRPVPSRVLVGALFRPPALYATAGDSSSADVATPSREIPYPLGTVMPVFPPLAHGAGVVLLEALVGASGGVESVQVIKSGPPFDSAAEDAARRWLFRPAYVAPRAEPRYVYLVFGFPAPMTGAAGPKPR
ncbi:MAG TPA: TonB family protein [Vicinamibacterales bacterium]|jgi:TonB family protein